MEHPISDVARLAGVTTRTLRHYDQIGLQMAERREQLKEQLSMAGDPSDRATTEGEPATMKASEKSEAVLEGAKKPEIPPQRARTCGNKRSRRAEATSGRRSR